MEGTTYAQKLGAQYIFSRLNVTQKSPGGPVEVDLKPLTGDAIIGVDGVGSNDIDVYYDELVSNEILGQLPCIANIKYVLHLSFD